MKIEPIVVVFPERDCTSLLSESTLHDLPEFPILPLLSSATDPSSGHAPSAVVLALPRVLLESARSHVLEEPVPREAQVRDKLVKIPLHIPLHPLGSPLTIVVLIAPMMSSG